ncbi:hypothetical protein FNV58_01035 (plasmid) [Streptomyces sp. RLB1-9]|uniref:hypothetical protein n=1 Tax=Streptomyces sp. RLB1-9 TaxID=2594454 RepID=UPI001164934F|nr:hypothetical protein [Streptomyces sp. RLB1-9]QDN94945.1 hypothetical protein FNV58_01035 [Streptomyces sp. RLB1-9]
MSVIEIKRKPTARQVEALRTGTTNPEGIIEVTADKRTHEGLVGRGLADWKRPETLGLGRSVHGTALCVINSQGRDYLAKLDGVEITRDDVAEGKRLALAYLGFGERRREAEQAPASVVLKGEFARVRRVMRRAMRNAGAEAANNALNQYNRTHALLLAARRFDQEDAATAAQDTTTTTEEAPVAETPVHDPYAPTPGIDVDGRPYAVGDTVESTHRARTGARRGKAAEVGTVTAVVDGRPVVRFTTGDQDETDVRPDLFRITTPAAPVNEPADFRGLTRDDVAHDAAQALATLSDDDRATVEGKAPSVVLGLAFRRAQTAWCATRREHTAEESAVYDRQANIASAALIFERADDPEAAATARADDFRITNAERAAKAKRIEEARARALVVEWANSEPYRGYAVRTEDRGHGIIAVYVRGSADESSKIEKAGNAYAREHLTFEPGLSAHANGGGEFFQGEYIAQMIYTTKRLAPRED